MNLTNFLNKKIKITQVKSGLKLNRRQKQCLGGLGLKGIGSKSDLEVTKCIIGMLKRINHIINIHK